MEEKKRNSRSRVIVVLHNDCLGSVDMNGFAVNFESNISDVVLEKTTVIKEETGIEYIQRINFSCKTQTHHEVYRSVTRDDVGRSSFARIIVLSGSREKLYDRDKMSVEEFLNALYAELSKRI